jgi:hypothetical protein
MDGWLALFLSTSAAHAAAHSTRPQRAAPLLPHCSVCCHTPCHASPWHASPCSPALCPPSATAGIAAIKNLRALRTFELVPAANTACSVTDVGMRLLGYLSRLQVLKLTNAHAVTKAGMQQLFRLPGLLSLHLDGMKALDDACLAKMATTLSALTSLRVGRWGSSEQSWRLCCCR